MRHLHESTPTFSDWEGVHDAVADAYFPHALRPRSEGSAARSELEVVDLSLVRVAHIRFGATVDISTDHAGAVAINLQLRGSMESVLGGTSVTTEPGQAAIFPADTPARLPAWTPDSDVLGLRVDEDYLARESERVLARKGLVLPRVVDLSGPEGRAWVAMARTTLRNARDCGGVLYRDPRVAESVSSMLVTGLLLAAVPGTRGLGLASAVGLVIALLAVVLVLPAALALVGRRVFWPFVPRPGDELSHEGIWAKVARAVVASPAAFLVSGLAVLAVLATGISGVSIGLSQADSFRTASESADGLVTVGEHFPAGASAPFSVTTDEGSADETADALRSVDGVAMVAPSGTNGSGLASLTVIGEPSPGTPASLELAGDLRTAAHDVPGADARVGGGSAELLDARAAAESDLTTVVPLVLLVTFAVLVVLLRAVVGPLVLLALNAMSALAAIGLGSWLDEHLLGNAALDVQVPLVAFLFLVALGVDYTIFLMHRARAEAAEHGTREGVARAVARTGAVITSAGVVLAAVFAALGVLPLVVLGQLGLIVGIGVLLDTLLVRTLVVPAATALLGDRFWWPGRVASRS